jgi:hypothetical protein
LVRHGLVGPKKRKRRRADYRRFKRPRAMQLWQMDIVGGFHLADRTELKAVTRLADHSRYCVSALLFTFGLTHDCPDMIEKVVDVVAVNQTRVDNKGATRGVDLFGDRGMQAEQVPAKGSRHGDGVVVTGGRQECADSPGTAPLSRRRWCGVGWPEVPSVID